MTPEFTAVLVTFAVTCLLQFLDVRTTWIIVTEGLGYESNPLIKKLIDMFGLAAALAVPKAITLAVLGFVVFNIPMPFPVIFGLLWALNCFYFVIVRNNIGIINP
jgi:hypothetical protein